MFLKIKRIYSRFHPWFNIVDIIFHQSITFVILVNCMMDANFHPIIYGMKERFKSKLAFVFWFYLTENPIARVLSIIYMKSWHFYTDVFAMDVKFISSSISLLLLICISFTLEWKDFSIQATRSCIRPCRWFFFYRSFKWKWWEMKKSKVKV